MKIIAADTKGIKPYNIKEDKDTTHKSLVQNIDEYNYYLKTSEDGFEVCAGAEVKKLFELGI
jgi:hypothetical protein